MKIVTQIILLYILCSLELCVARFSTNGQLTVTMKDPDVNSAHATKWLDISALRPRASCSIQSKGPPLPNSVPFFKSLRGNVDYDRVSLSPAVINVDLRFAKEGVGDLQIQPAFNVRQKRARCTIEATKGNSINIVARLGRKLEAIKGNFMFQLPGSLPLTTIKVSPAINFLQNNHPSVTIEGMTSSGRTKALLNFQRNRSPTLTVVHALDDKNIISPEISLYDAKIVYNWDVIMQSGSIRTTVDPTEAIDIQWTDQSMDGKWVTDINLPLKGTSLKALTPNLKLRRQFSF